MLFGPMVYPGLYDWMIAEPEVNPPDEENPYGTVDFPHPNSGSGSSDTLDPAFQQFWDAFTSYFGGLFESSGEAAEKQRVFNAAEAQKEREWQEMMRSTYWQDMVAGMEASGLNPRVVFSGGSLPTMPTPTGAAASSGIPQTDTLASMITSISSLIDAIVGAVNPIRRMESFVTSNNTNRSYSESHLYRHRGN